MKHTTATIQVNLTHTVLLPDINVYEWTAPDGTEFTVCERRQDSALTLPFEVYGNDRRMENGPDAMCATLEKARQYILGIVNPEAPKPAPIKLDLFDLQCQLVSAALHNAAPEAKTVGQLLDAIRMDADTIRQCLLSMEQDGEAHQSTECGKNTRWSLPS